MQHSSILSNQPARTALPPCYNDEAFAAVGAFHRALEGYAPTPLVSLDSLAKELGVGGIFVKDESKRFGLNAFKALGASYAVHEALRDHPDAAEVVTATDGNHGRAVAWAARQAGKKATVFMPAGSAPCRVAAIAQFDNATVTVTKCNYDDAVRMAAAYARQTGACLVQDTAFAGYEDIPQNIVLGYSTMAAEALEQMHAQCGHGPTHVFLQAGVGSMAGGVLAYLVHRMQPDPPCFTVMEAEQAACIYESVRQGHTVAIGGNPQTAMAGLNCGEPNIATLPLLKDHAAFFCKCADEVTYEGMRRLAHPVGTDRPVVSGESGAVGLGLVMQLLQDSALLPWKQKMGLDETARILLFSTEGDTDPQHYREIVEG